MLKKIVYSLIVLFVGISVSASDNFLSSIVLSNDNGNSSLIFRTDEIAKIKRDVESEDKMIVTLKNVKQSADIDTLYHNAYNVKGLIIQQENNNDLKIYVEAPNISKANIIFETPNSAPITVADNFKEGRIAWSIISIALLLLVIRSAKNVSLETPQKNVNEIIKDRELQLYRNFQKEIQTLPSIGYKLKSYRKHVLKGETIRSYKNRLSRI